MDDLQDNWPQKIKYFGMGAVLPAVSDAFWINFSSYYFCNLFDNTGNVIFLFSEIVEGLGLLLGWILLQCFRDKDNIQGRIYMMGAMMVIITFPLIFLPPLSILPLIYGLTLVFKIGNGLMVISQLNAMSIVIKNSNQKNTLLQKMAIFGYMGIFISMFLMTIFSMYFSFIWKYFIGVGIFTSFGGICSIFYTWKVTMPLQPLQSQHNYFEWKQLKSYSIIVGSIIFILVSLYLNVIMAIYPYFIRMFDHITHLKYLTAIVFLYLSAMFCSIVTKKISIFMEVRSLISIGLFLAGLSCLSFVTSFLKTNFGVLIYLGTCLAGIAKVIALNSFFSFLRTDNKSEDFIYGFYYFCEKIVLGLVLYGLLSNVYKVEEQKLLNFSWIYLPFILYSTLWMLTILIKAIAIKQSSLEEKVIE